MTCSDLLVIKSRVRFLSSAQVARYVKFQMMKVLCWPPCFKILLPIIVFIGNNNSNIIIMDGTIVGSED